MPHKGESASFFSLHFYCNIQAGLPQPPPFLPPSRRSPPPLLRRESWAGEVSKQEPKLCTSSESPRRRATAGERERRRARGWRPAHSQRQRGLSSREELRLQAQQKPRPPAPASPNAPGRRERTKKLCGAPGPGTAARTSLRRLLCPAEGPASAQRAGAPRKRRESRLAALPPARPPSGFVLLSAGAQKSAGTRAPRGTAPAASPSRVHRQRQSHAGDRERERVSGIREEATRPKRSNARSEGAQSRAGGLSASIKPPGYCPQLERKARNLKTLCFPVFPQPSPSPCESWGLPCPSVPSARWVFFLVFL